MIVRHLSTSIRCFSFQQNANFCPSIDSNRRVSRNVVSHKYIRRTKKENMILKQYIQHDKEYISDGNQRHHHNTKEKSKYEDFKNCNGNLIKKIQNMRFADETISEMEKIHNKDKKGNHNLKVR
jgi:hypothetical protein